jgi:hypothetical protein
MNIFFLTAALVVIAILDIKLLLSNYEHFYPVIGLSVFLKIHTADIRPILTSMLLTSQRNNQKCKIKMEF